MDDDQLRELFSSLAVLAQQGPIPVTALNLVRRHLDDHVKELQVFVEDPIVEVTVQAYSVLVHNHSPEALAEQLHQRWLADGRFANIAANIVLHVRKTNSSGLALSSCILALLLNDYRNRLEVRNRSKLMFRNSVKALFEIYTVFLEIDSCIAKCLEKPMFKCLDLLLDNHPDSEDLVTMGVLLTEHGMTLNNLNPYLIDRLIVKMREKICSDDDQMNGYIRRIFLHVLDLWAFGWNELTIPESLTMQYTDNVRDDSPVRERKKNVGKQEFGSKESIV